MLLPFQIVTRFPHLIQQFKLSDEQAEAILNLRLRHLAKLEEMEIKAEQAALAETEASRKVVNADITNKMLAVCQKKWAKGEHRCYCQKFIEHAPAGIESNPSCAAE